MNADAARGVDVAVTAGAEVPGLPWVATVLLSLAVLALGGAVVLIAVPLRSVSRQGGDRG